jgi:hypothetical protein
VNRIADILAAQGDTDPDRGPAGPRHRNLGPTRRSVTAIDRTPTRPRSAGRFRRTRRPQRHRRGETRLPARAGPRVRARGRVEATSRVGARSCVTGDCVRARARVGIGGGSRDR